MPKKKQKICKYCEWFIFPMYCTAPNAKHPYTDEADTCELFK